MPAVSSGRAPEVLAATAVGVLVGVIISISVRHGDAMKSPSKSPPKSTPPKSAPKSAPKSPSLTNPQALTSTTNTTTKYKVRPPPIKIDTGSGSGIISPSSPSSPPDTPYNAVLLFQRYESLRLTYPDGSVAIQAKPGLCVYVSFEKQKPPPTANNALPAGDNKNKNKKKKKEKGGNGVGTDALGKACDAVMNVRLLPSRMSLATAEASSLTVIPSANLTSKLKKHQFQYHEQVPRGVAEGLFGTLVGRLRVAAAGKADFVAGKFGETQSLVVDSSGGPFMHRAVLS
mmetsp:Transcript_26379/g.52633  ORF Transcript_26379/g.52633 Transcript_26379/m.52633 type:complete len:287 (-) Transcript_26379:38-898(-)